MQNKLNLELKYHCKDFSTIRKILERIGAKKVGVFSQKDYFFNLPKGTSNTARLKLRIQNNKHTLIYYERPNFQKSRANPSDILIFPIKDKNFLDLLVKILGVKAIVQKERELWVKGNALFNLDTVKKIGKIFEIEITTAKENQKRDQATFEKYQKEFLPYLGKMVKGSNIDLVLKS